MCATKENCSCGCKNKINESRLANFTAKLEALTGKKVSLKEGTWVVPDTAKKATRLKEIIQQLEQGSGDVSEFYKTLWNVYGDDHLMDDLDNVLDKTKPALTKVLKRHIAGLVKGYEKRPDEFRNWKNAIPILKSILVPNDNLGEAVAEVINEEVSDNLERELSTVIGNYRNRMTPEEIYDVLHLLAERMKNEF